MNSVGALGVILFAYGISLLDQGSGLTCKSGEALHMRGHLPYKNETIEKCHFSKRHCVTIYCLSEGNPVYAFTYWQCHWTEEKKCQNRAQEELEKINVTNPRCNCTYGDYNMNMTNDTPPLEVPAEKEPSSSTVAMLTDVPTQTDVPTPSDVPTSSDLPTPSDLPIPTDMPTPNLKCLIGKYNHKGYGKVGDGKCEADDQFCFVASCKPVSNCTDTEMGMMWDCARNKDCAAIEARFGDAFKCHCKFGERGVSGGNENMSLALWKLPRCSTDELLSLRCLLLRIVCKKGEHANAKFSRRFKAKMNCATVKERVDTVTMLQIESLSKEFMRCIEHSEPMFLEDFVP